MTVRMTHPISGGTYDAQPSQVPHLRESGWEVEPGQVEQGEVWPAEAQRFDGQEQVRLHNPTIEGDPVITVAASAVPQHRSDGWLLVADAAETEGGVGLESLTVEELKEEARARGLPVSGTKAELVERLGAEQEPEPAEPGEEDEA